VRQGYSTTASSLLAGCSWDPYNDSMAVGELHQWVAGIKEKHTLS